MDILEAAARRASEPFAATRRERVLARLMAERLDHALVAGVPPETSRLLSVRASVLGSRRHRRALARSLEAAIDEANGTAPPTVRMAPVQRAAVRGVTQDLHEVAQRLVSLERVPARFVAIVHRLVTDGTGPLYNAKSANALPIVTRSALEAAHR